MLNYFLVRKEKPEKTFQDLHQKNLPVFLIYMSHWEILKLLNCQFDPYVYLNYFHALLQTEGNNCGDAPYFTASLLGNFYSVFSPQSFIAPFLAFLLFAYIWVEAPFSSWAPMTKPVFWSSGRGTQQEGQLGRGVTAGAALIPDL